MRWRIYDESWRLGDRSKAMIRLGDHNIERLCLWYDKMEAKKYVIC